MISKKEEYISLREAAALSGYSPDYVGQLIRNGKLPGKQVFANVAWMTTPEAVREYMKERGKGAQKEAERSSVLSVLEREIEAPRLVKRLAVALIIVCAAFLLLLFYVFSAALDQRLNQRALERLERQT
jgi:hypothetical protein